MFKTLNAKDNLLIGLAGIIALLYGLALIPQAAQYVACGTWPSRTGPLNFIHLIAGNDPSAVWGLSDTECVVSTTTIRVTGFIAIALITALVTLLVIRYLTYRRSDAWMIKDIRSREEIADGRDIAKAQGAKTTVERGSRVRPSIPKKSLCAADVAWRIGVAGAKGGMARLDVWICMEDATLILGPPRSGKGYMILTAAIIEAPGAVVTTSSRGDNMEATIAARSKKGPVYLFDPERVTGRETTIRWSPIRGCEDPQIARSRAATLVAGGGLRPDGNNAEWGTAAIEILMFLLHAAAVSGASIETLWRWSASSAAAHQAADALDTYSDLGWGQILRHILDMDSKTLENRWFGVKGALSTLSVPSVREVFETHQAGMFDPKQFLKDSGTLYLTAELRSTAPGAAGGVGVFFSMILDDIQHAAHEISQTTPGGRLDPPVSFILDEIANIHPWGGLPQAMAAGSGEGLQVVAVFQSRSQARDGWGDQGERTIWESATRKIMLGGAADTTDIRTVVDLLGVRKVTSDSASYGPDRETSWSEQTRDEPVISIDEIRRLPERNALLIGGRARPMLINLIPWNERKWADQVIESKNWHSENPPGDKTRLGRTWRRAA